MLIALRPHLARVEEVSPSLVPAHIARQTHSGPGWQRLHPAKVLLEEEVKGL